MRKADAEREILAEMRDRLPEVPYLGADGGLVQFSELQRDRPELFGFRSSADKWQLVQGWLRRENLVASAPNF
jgi:hypothetical protein